MLMNADLCGLIHRGGVFNIEASTAEEAYKIVCNKMHLPVGMDKDIICDELILRENVLSTAVGNGIAIPHPRRPILHAVSDQRIALCFFNNPIDMHAPDNRKVYVMFILLSATTQFHLEVLSELAVLFRNTEFRSLLETKPTEKDLLIAIKQAGF